MKCIKKPIRLSPNAVAIIHMFYKESNFEDIWMFENEQYEIDNYDNYQESANEFIDQLEDHYCIAFLEALHKRIGKELEEHRNGI